MGVSEKTMKILWANSAGLCSFENCRKKLTLVSEEAGLHSVIGEMAHIKGEKPKANRYDPNLSEDEVNDYNNLMLMCPNHHTLIDKKEQELVFTVEILRRMKSEHISFVNNRVAVQKESLGDLAKKILNLLADNRAAWESYGPNSEVARKNPHSEDGFKMWESARLSTIVPNNRTITKILRLNREVFRPEDSGLIAKFIIHSESYEKWVNGEIEYAAVVRFPEEFQDLIHRSSIGSN